MEGASKGGRCLGGVCVRLCVRACPFGEVAHTPVPMDISTADVRGGNDGGTCGLYSTTLANLHLSPHVRSTEFHLLRGEWIIRRQQRCS
eukprot:7132843-Pyramimonas_sp.AAC.1